MRLQPCTFLWLVLVLLEQGYLQIFFVEISLNNLIARLLSFSQFRGFKVSSFGLFDVIKLDLKFL
jgi:hypothetical protein